MKRKISNNRFFMGRGVFLCRIFGSEKIVAVFDTVLNIYFNDSALNLLLFHSLQFLAYIIVYIMTVIQMSVVKFVSMVRW